MKLFITFALLAALPAAADEGLWPWNQIPHDVILQKHAFDATPAFLEHLRLSSVRIAGRSGSFVSPTGLIATDRLTAASCLPSAQDSFIATTSAAEVKCTGLDASVLLSMEDVSTQIKTGDKQTLTQRNAAIAKVEKDCASRTGDVCTVIRLFSGGRYDLYRYKRYGDVRLVFAPEFSAAFFGKERDSISYLRYGLDMAFLRAYENGQPAKTPQYLTWSGDGVKDGDLIFAAGNPGPTSRLATAAQLTFYRDSSLPIEVSRLQQRIQLAGLPPLVNTFKIEAGKLIGLRDDRLVTRKTNFEGKIKRALQTDSKLGPDSVKVWDEVAAAYKKWTPFEREYQVIENPGAIGSQLFDNARRKLRGEPLDPAAPPVNKDQEILMLTRYLDDLRIVGGESKKAVKKDTSFKTPKLEAEAMVNSPTGVEELVKELEPEAQKLRKQHEEIIGNLEVTAAEKIALYRFKLFGAADYPEGTSTPRFEFGVVSGYTDRAAVAQPFASTFSGLFYRKNNDGPWQVSQRWIDARSSLDEVIPLNFVSTCDTGGGDYGSPVVNQAGDLVGITFDGNLESLPNVFLYTSDQARAVHVDARGIVQALTKVYKADGLVKELTIRGPQVSAR